MLNYLVASRATILILLRDVTPRREGERKRKKFFFFRITKEEGRLSTHENNVFCTERAWASAEIYEQSLRTMYLRSRGDYLRLIYSEPRG